MVYLAEYYSIDGTAYDADDFGETDDTTNQWIPKDASGLTFGTNGFYQKYAATELANSFTDSSMTGRSVNCDILIVGGGGGGGWLSSGGGGGAGGFVYYSQKSITGDTDHTVTIGAGGATASYTGVSGDDSIFGALTTADGGGGGGGSEGGRAGGSGGGSGAGAYSGGSATANQGFDGGDGGNPSNLGAGGGGGASAVGATGTSSSGVAGSGGAGYTEGTSSVYDWTLANGTTATFDINGTGNAYAGGGGGGAGVSQSGGGVGGAGGGGRGGKYTDTGSPAIAGTANTGGGGGGGGAASGPTGQAGGSGVVIVRYDASSGTGTGGTITSYEDGGTTYTVHTFTASGTFSMSGHTITANGDVANTRAIGDFQFDYLVVAGGAGGGGGAAGSGGGGGAGGLRSGATSLIVDKPYTVTVGAAGAGGAAGTAGVSGSNSSVGSISATGGGRGGYSSSQTASAGGSGGGGGDGNSPQSGAAGNAGSYSPVEGYAGGNQAGSSNNWGGGGGGGSSAIGTNGGTNVGGDGGDGASSSITGAAVDYAGGGGGGTWNSGSSGSTGGDGGGGAGGQGASVAGSNATGYGSGGGGAGQDGTGGDGSDGIVIISYISASALATGGTITTYTNGDTYQVHTFTSSGTFTPTAKNVTQGTSSIAFDGTGDYLEIPASSDWKFGTGAYTVEMWFYTAATTQGYFYVCNNLGSISPNWQGLGIEIRTSANSSTVYVNEQVDNTDHYFESTTTGLNDGAWHHMAVSRESAGDAKLFIDGTHEATQDDNYDFDSGGVVNIGRQNWGPGGYFDGYIDEIRVSDTARYTTTFTPQTTQFTADANTLLLIHSDFDGGLGADSSGNANDFAVTNLVATDQMVDSPTNNFATLNPLVMSYDSPNYSEGNLEVTGAYANSSYGNAAGTITVSSGKWYWEDYNKSSFYPSYSNRIGIKSDTALSSDAVNPQDHTGTIIYISDGNKRIDGVDTSYGATYTDGDIIGVALDLDSGTQTITFYKNGSSQGAITISGGCSTAASLAPVCIPLLTRDVQLFNFGQDSSFAGNVTAQGNQDGSSVGDFYYEPPSGYLALCTSNLPAPSIKLPGDNFNTVLWTGNATADRAITGVGFQTDMLWIKNRGAAEGHKLVDGVRGATKYIVPNNIDAEATDSDMVTSLDSDGFTIGAQASVNQDTKAIVGWNWLGANSTATNTDGDIPGTVTVSANPTAGFSIVTYTGNASAGVSVGHGLGEALDLLLVKDLTSQNDWRVYCRSMARPQDSLKLNTTASSIDDNTVWDDTQPDATVFTIGDNADVNTSGNGYVAYCFHSVEGYSKVGSYEGNSNADGSFIYLGFRPAWVMIKRYDSSNNWALRDNKRDTYNVTDHLLMADNNNAESLENDLDFVSNGMKMRENAATINQGDYIYLAFAKSPFKYANSR